MTVVSFGIPEPGGLLWLEHASKLHFDDTSSKFKLKHKNFKIYYTVFYFFKSFKKNVNLWQFKSQILCMPL
jgi:hypothetical protein